MNKKPFLKCSGIVWPFLIHKKNLRRGRVAGFRNTENKFIETKICNSQVQNYWSRKARKHCQKY